MYNYHYTVPLCAHYHCYISTVKHNKSCIKQCSNENTWSEEESPTLKLCSQFMCLSSDENKMCDLHNSNRHFGFLTVNAVGKHHTKKPAALKHRDWFAGTQNLDSDSLIKTDRSRCSSFLINHTSCFHSRAANFKTLPSRLPTLQSLVAFHSLKVQYTGKVLLS